MIKPDGLRHEPSRATMPELTVRAASRALAVLALECPASSLSARRASRALAVFALERLASSVSARRASCALAVFALLALWGIASCVSPERLPIDVGAGELLVVARTDPRGELLDVASALGGRGVSFELAEGERIFVWSLAPDQILGASLDQLTALRAGEIAAGGCGRCLAPAVGPPKLMMPGETCPPPRFAKAHAFTRADGELTAITDPATIDAMRANVRLAVPGECPCADPAPRETPRAIMCPLLPEDSPISPNRAVAFDDGRIVAAGSFATIDIPITGRPAVRPLSPPLGLIRAIGVLPGTSEALIASEEPSRFRDRVKLHRLDAAGAMQEIAGLPPIRVNGIRALEADGSFYLAGKAVPDLAGASPTVARCTRTVDGVITCANQPLITDTDCLPAGLTGIVSITALAGGAAIGVGDKGHVFLRPAGSERWYCDSRTDGLDFDARGTRVDPLEIYAVEALGDRLFYCGTFIDAREKVQGGVVTAAIPRALQTGPEPPFFDVAYELAHFNLPGECTGITRIDRDRVRVTLKGGAAALDLDAGGALLALHLQPPYPELPEPLDRIETTTTGFTIAYGSAGGIYRRAPAAISFERAYGPSRPDVRSVSAIAAMEDDRAAIFRSGSSPSIARATGTACSTIQTEAIDVAGFPPLPEASFAFDVAIRDHRSPDTFIVTAHDARRTHILRVDLASRTAETVAESDLLLDVAFQGGVELIEGVFVFLAFDGRVFELRDQQIRGVELVRDDPETEVVETTNSEALYAIDGIARSGVAWISGRNQLARVIWTPAGTRVEDFWFIRTGGGVLEGAERVGLPRFPALSVSCADRAVLIAQERVRKRPSDPEDALIAWRLVHDPNDAEKLILVHDRDFDPDVHTGPVRDEDAIGILRRGPNLTVIYEHGTVQRLGSDDRLVAPFPDIVRAISTETFDVIGGVAQHAAIILEQR